MDIQNDPVLKRKVQELEKQQNAQLKQAEKELRQSRKATLRKSAKNRILTYTALALALFLVWQKLHIIIFIPGSFTTLAIIVAALFIALYLGLHFLFDPE